MTETKDVMKYLKKCKALFDSVKKDNIIQIQQSEASTALLVEFSFRLKQILPKN